MADGGRWLHPPHAAAHGPTRRSNSRATSTLKSVDGSIPPALQRAVIEFDRDGRLSTQGLPTCDPSLLEEATPQEARERCPRAIVGTGHVGALIAMQGRPSLYASSLLTIFNGPRQEGHPTAIFHARTTVPADPELRHHGPDRTPARRLPLPRHHRHPADRGRPWLPHPPRRRHRPPLPLRRQRAQLRLGPLPARRPQHLRPLHLRRRHHPQRQRRKGLHPSLSTPVFL